ncbi:uncharacterized protein DNG_04068 [Cephalotrichum gorgonifer]|uniref:DUF1308 domain-containing protein n=1 Tax=Cephalotrichum gorgonifer TaxID=2041049 RepID=A0AAE8SU76_9PEZI|nr:uncharacterized protein DNG_04068 [Cephalotrichum gorgonifer]
MHTELPTRQAPPAAPAPEATPANANGCRDAAADKDDERRHQAQRLADDATSVADRILAEVERLLELDVAANLDAPKQHSPRLAQPRIHLTNLTRQLQRERNGAEKYLADFLSAHDDVDRDLSFTRLSCLNITFYDTLWNVVKRQRGLVSALREIEVPASSPPRGPSKKKARRNMAKVDAMVENGAEWIKIITADERRLIFQMTNAGWDWEAEDGEPGIDTEETESTGIEAIDAVKDLVAAAVQTRVGPYHYQTPRVKVIFPRITEGASPHIDALIKIIRTLGDEEGASLSVECGAPEPLPPTTLDETLRRLLPREDFFFSPVLNLDCTILFNLGSDTAHFNPDSFESRTEARIKEDLEDERRNGPRLPCSIYPVFGGRSLVCTDEVAVNFRNTAFDIGTETEIARAKILLPPADAPIPTPEPTEEERRDILRAFQELSVHEVPLDLQLPIRVVKTPSHKEVEEKVAKGVLPAVLLRLDERIKSMNASAMVQGWMHEQTTLTSNRQGMNLMNQIVSEAGEGAARAGNTFHVWMAPFGRRLAARPKGGNRSAGESPEPRDSGEE